MKSGESGGEKAYLQPLLCPRVMGHVSIGQSVGRRCFFRSLASINHDGAGWRSLAVFFPRLLLTFRLIPWNVVIPPVSVFFGSRGYPGIRRSSVSVPETQLIHAYV